jgi:hypothetical protein
MIQNIQAEARTAQQKILWNLNGFLKLVQ